MIYHEVENDANAVRFCPAGQHVEVGQRAVHGIDVFVVGNVIAEIHLR